jgi:hypothetical protein
MIKKENILTAEEGFLIMHINKLCAGKEVALGKEADPKDWVQIPESFWDSENDIYIGEKENNFS